MDYEAPELTQSASAIDSVQAFGTAKAVFYRYRDASGGSVNEFGPTFEDWEE